MGRAPADDLSFADAPSETASSAAGGLGAATDAPTVIVRRKRQLERPSEARPEESRGDGEARRPRVFLLSRSDDGEGAGDPSQEDEHLLPLPPGGAPGAAAGGEPAVAPASPRRRATPAFRRAGPVTIERPLEQAFGDHEDVEAPEHPSLAQLMAQFEELNARLAALTARPARRLDLDLTIQARWAVIDDALQALHDSLPADDWEMGL